VFLEKFFLNFWALQARLGFKITESSVADPEVSDRIRIRILALLKDPILTFLVSLKAISTSGISVVYLFGFSKILFRTYFHQKNFRKKVARKFILLRIRIRTFSKVGSGFGSGQKSSGSATLPDRLNYCRYKQKFEMLGV
jgi:hypothetical protein